MMKQLLLTLSLFLSVPAIADVKWDIPIKDTGKLDGRTYVMNLEKGDKSRIEIDAFFCTSEEGNLMIDGLSVAGEGDISIKILKNNKAELEVDDLTTFLDELAWGESFARCSWWTSHKGEFVVAVDNINGKKSLTALIKAAN